MTTVRERINQEGRVLKEYLDGNLIPRDEHEATVAEAVAREREQAAQIADKWANTRPVAGDDAPAIATIMSETGKAIASAIRSGEEP